MKAAINGVWNSREFEYRAAKIYQSLNSRFLHCSKGPQVCNGLIHERWVKLSMVLAIHDKIHRTFSSPTPRRPLPAFVDLLDPGRSKRTEVSDILPELLGKSIERQVVNSEAQFLEHPWNIADGSGQVNAKKPSTLKVGLYKFPWVKCIFEYQGWAWAVMPRHPPGTGPKRACIIPSFLSLDYYLDTDNNIRTMQ